MAVVKSNTIEMKDLSGEEINLAKIEASLHYRTSLMTSAEQTEAEAVKKYPLSIPPHDWRKLRVALNVCFHFMLCCADNNCFPYAEMIFFLFFVFYGFLTIFFILMNLLNVNAPNCENQFVFLSMFLLLVAGIIGVSINVYKQEQNESIMAKSKSDC